MKALVCAVLIAAPALAANIPDPLITTQAKVSLWTTRGLRSHGISVDTADGIVTLHGRVPSAEQRTLAESAALRVDGVRQVRNLLQVVPEAEAKAIERSDKELKEHLDKVLKDDRGLADSRIRVKSVDNGAVVLTGKASSANDHLRAVQLAHKVPGVKRVSSEIEALNAVGPRKSVLDDVRISSAVKLRLWTTPNVPSTEISVDTDGRVVTLFGIVPTVEARATAEREAAKVDGVAKVVNHLQVVAPERKELVEAKDKDLEQNLKLAFKDREELKGVTTDVRNGIVRLTGTVDNEWDKVTAVRVARFTSGVRGVEDLLVVREKGQRVF